MPSNDQDTPSMKDKYPLAFEPVNPPPPPFRRLTDAELDVLPIPGVDRTAPLIVQMDQIDMALTEKYMELDQNMAEIHEIIQDSILPALKRYAVSTQPVREVAKFWLNVFHLASLPVPDELKEIDITLEESRTHHHDESSTSATSDEPHHVSSSFTSGTSAASGAPGPPSSTSGTSFTSSEQERTPTPSFTSLSSRDGHDPSFVASTPAGQHPSTAAPPSEISWAASLESPYERAQRQLTELQTLSPDESHATATTAASVPRASQTNQIFSSISDIPSVSSDSKGKERGAGDLRTKVLQSQMKTQGQQPSLIFDTPGTSFSSTSSAQRHAQSSKTALGEGLDSINPKKFISIFTKATAEDIVGRQSKDTSMAPFSPVRTRKEEEKTAVQRVVKDAMRAAGREVLFGEKGPIFMKPQEHMASPRRGDIHPIRGANDSMQSSVFTNEADDTLNRKIRRATGGSRRLTLADFSDDFSDEDDFDDDEDQNGGYAQDEGQGYSQQETRTQREDDSWEDDEDEDEYDNDGGGGATYFAQQQHTDYIDDDAEDDTMSTGPIKQDPGGATETFFGPRPGAQHGEGFALRGSGRQAGPYSPDDDTTGLMSPTPAGQAQGRWRQ